MPLSDARRSTDAIRELTYVATIPSPSGTEIAATSVLRAVSEPSGIVKPF